MAIKFSEMNFMIKNIGSIVFVPFLLVFSVFYFPSFAAWIDNQLKS